MNDVMNLRTDYTKNDKNDLEKAVPFPPVEVDQPGGEGGAFFILQLSKKQLLDCHIAQKNENIHRSE